MNPFFISFLALCVAQGAVAQYQSGGASSGSYGQQQGSGYQRKMSPSPQSYGNSGAYVQQRDSYEPANSYEQPAPMSAYQQPAPQQQYQQASQQSYKAPSSAQVSTYDERTPAASSYGKAAPKYETAASSYGQSAQRPSSSYGQQQHASSYGQQQQASSYGQQQSYAKAAPKYEEPSHPPMPFAWGYDINDGYGGAQYHKESGDEYGKRTGSYGYTDAYGIYRQVDYVADEHGFRATIKTNEPGTANESPADVELHAYEPPSNYYAGNTNSYNSGSSSYGSGKQSSGSSYGQQQQQQQQSYSRPAASASTSSYSAQTTYAPAAARSSSYKTAAIQAPASGYSRQQASSSYESAGQQYASASAIVPVYQKPAAAAKRN